MVFAGEGGIEAKVARLGEGFRSGVTKWRGGRGVGGEAYRGIAATDPWRRRDAISGLIVMGLSL